MESLRINQFHFYSYPMVKSPNIDFSINASGLIIGRWSSIKVRWFDHRTLAGKSMSSGLE